MNTEHWVPITPETMPEMGQSVALVNVNRWENCGGDKRRNIHACGYLEHAGCWRPYWSIRGQRPQELDSFTHWIALPDPPGYDDEQEPTP